MASRPPEQPPAAKPAEGIAPELKIGVDHFLDQFFKRCLRLPAKLGFGLGRVSQQAIDLGRSHKCFIDHDVVLSIQPSAFKGDIAHLLDRSRAASGNKVIVRFVLLEHQPHRFDIVLRVAPIALGLQIPKRKLLGSAELNLSYTMSHFARDKFKPTQWRLVIK